MQSQDALYDRGEIRPNPGSKSTPQEGDIVHEVMRQNESKLQMDLRHHLRKGVCESKKEDEFENE